MPGHVTEHGEGECRRTNLSVVHEPACETLSFLDICQSFNPILLGCRIFVLISKSFLVFRMTASSLFTLQQKSGLHKTK